MGAGSVLLLSQHLSRDAQSADRPAQELLEHLHAAGFRARGVSGPARYADIDVENADAATVERLLGTRLGRSNLLGKALDAATFAAGLAMHEAQDDAAADVVCTVTTPPMLPVLGARMARRRGAKLVLWCQDLWPQVGTALGVWKAGGWVERGLARLTRAATEQADRVVALSDRMRERLQEAGVAAAKIVDVPQWAPLHAFDRPDPEAVAAARRALGAGDDDMVVLYPGHLGRIHEFDTVLQAARELAGRMPIRFVFTARGSQRAAVERRAEGLPNVHFAPAVTSRDLAARLRAADVHLITLRPGFDGLTIPGEAAAAWASERPTLFVGPPRSQLVRASQVSEVGLHADNGDVATVVKSLGRMLEYSGYRRGLGTSARKWAERQHHPARNLPRMAEVIQGLC